MLVQVAGVAITTVNPDDPDDFDEFEVDGLRVDDLFFEPLDNLCPLTSTFADIAGVLTYSFGNSKLGPRDEADFGQPQCVPY